MWPGVSQGGEGLQRVEGSGRDGGQLVVVEGQQAHVVQPREAVVVDAADLVVPQHPEKPARRNREFREDSSRSHVTARRRVTHSMRSPSSPRNIPLRTESIWLAVRWSSMTDDAPSKAPSSTSVILLLLRLLQG